MQQSSVSSQQHNSCDEEISLFDLLETLWVKRWFIGLVTFVFAIAGFGYATLKLGNADAYNAIGFLEIGSYVDESGAIDILESNTDLALIITEKTGVAAKVPRGSKGLIVLSTVSEEPALARKLLIHAVEFVAKRHEIVVQRLSADRILRSSALVSELKVNNQYPNKKTLVVVASVLMGLFLSVVFVFLRKSFNERKQLIRSQIGKPMQ